MKSLWVPLHLSLYGSESHEAFILLFHGACKMWYYSFKYSIFHACYYIENDRVGYPHPEIFVKPDWLWNSGSFVSPADSEFLQKDDWRYRLRHFEIACEKNVNFKWESWNVFQSKKLPAWWVTSKTFPPGLNISMFILTVLIPAMERVAASVINALSCRHGRGCLSAVSIPFPVPFPDISLMWLDNKEIDSDHYAALKE